MSAVMFRVYRRFFIIYGRSYYLTPFHRQYLGEYTMQWMNQRLEYPDPANRGVFGG